MKHASTFFVLGHRFGVLACGAVLVSTMAAHSVAATSPSIQLPVKRVVLYSNGIAFVERRGRVLGSVDVQLPLRASQMDDALKSLIVLDLGKGRIGALSYESPSPPLFSEIPFSISSSTLDGERGGLAEVLRQFQGIPVEASDGVRRAVGRVLTVERGAVGRIPKTLRDEPDEAATPLGTFLVLAGDSGELVRLDIARLQTLRVLDGDSQRSLRDFTRAVSSVRRRSARTIAIAAAGSGERELLVSYATAAPVWKMTYRAALDASGVPFLQGWAIVDNASEDDWRGVRLSLVSGSPASFVQHLQQPLYKHRPVLPLASGLHVQPQSLGPLSVGPEGEGGEAGNFARGVEGGRPGGVVGGIVGGLPSAPLPVRVKASGEPVTTLSDIMAAEGSGVEVRTRPVVLGDLFDYRVDQPVDLARDHSALIPIVQTRIEGERVSLWRQERPDGRPVAALLLRNTTPLVLEAGPITVLDGDVYAGEAQLERVKPGEERFVSYAVDLGTHVQNEVTSKRGAAYLARATGGFFELHYHNTRTTTWSITNQTDRPRSLYIEQRRDKQWTLAPEGPEPAAVDDEMRRFRVDLVPMNRVQLPVVERQALVDRYSLEELTEAHLERLGKQGLVEGPLREGLARIVGLRAHIKQVEEQIAARIREMTEISSEQARVRENVRSLSNQKQARKAVNLWIQRVETQEARAQTLQTEKGHLAEDLEASKTELAVAIKTLSGERSL